MELVNICNNIEPSKPQQEMKSIIRESNASNRQEPKELSKLQELRTRLHKLKRTFLKRDCLIEHLLVNINDGTDFVESSKKLTQKISEIENTIILHKRIQDLQKTNTELPLKLVDAQALNVGVRRSCWSRTRNTGLYDTRNYSSNNIAQYNDIEVTSNPENFIKEKGSVNSTRHCSVLDNNKKVFANDEVTAMNSQRDLMKYTIIALVKKAQDQILRYVYKMDYRLNKHIETTARIDETLKRVKEKELNTVANIERANQLKSLEERMENLREAMLQEYKVIERENKYLKARNKELNISLEKYKKNSRTRANSARNLTVDYCKTNQYEENSIYTRVHLLKTKFDNLFNNHHELTQKKLIALSSKLDFLKNKKYARARIKSDMEYIGIKDGSKKLEQRMKEHLKELSNKICNQVKKLMKCYKTINVFKERYGSFKGKLVETVNSIHRLRNELKESNGKFKILELKLQEQTSLISEQKKIISSLNIELKSKESTSLVNEELNNTKDELEKKSYAFENSPENLSIKMNLNNLLLSKVELLEDKKVSNLKEQLNKKNTIIEELKSKINESDSIKDRMLKENKALLAKLKKKDAALKVFRGSTIERIIEIASIKFNSINTHLNNIISKTDSFSERIKKIKAGLVNENKVFANKQREIITKKVSIGFSNITKNTLSHIEFHINNLNTKIMRVRKKVINSVLTNKDKDYLRDNIMQAIHRMNTMVNESLISFHNKWLKLRDTITLIKERSLNEEKAAYVYFKDMIKKSFNAPLNVLVQIQKQVSNLKAKHQSITYQLMKVIEKNNAVTKKKLTLDEMIKAPNEDIKNLSDRLLQEGDISELKAIIDNYDKNKQILYKYSKARVKEISNEVNEKIAEFRVQTIKVENYLKNNINTMLNKAQEILNTELLSKENTEVIKKLKDLFEEEIESFNSLPCSITIPELLNFNKKDMKISIKQWYNSLQLITDAQRKDLCMKILKNANRLEELSKKVKRLNSIKYKNSILINKKLDTISNLLERILKKNLNAENLGDTNNISLSDPTSIKECITKLKELLTELKENREETYEVNELVQMNKSHLKYMYEKVKTAFTLHIEQLMTNLQQVQQRITNLTYRINKVVN